MSCKIYIKELDGTTRAVCVDSEELKNMTLKEFRRRFCPKDEQDHRFIFTGRQLEDGRTLGSYGINDCSTIDAVIRLRGGGAQPAEDEGEGMSRTESMDRLADMLQTEPESSSSVHFSAASHKSTHIHTVG